MQVDYDNAYHHAGEARYLTEGTEHETQKAQVHALLALHYDLKLLLEFLEYKD